MLSAICFHLDQSKVLTIYCTITSLNDPAERSFLKTNLGNGDNACIFSPNDD